MLRQLPAGPAFVGLGVFFYGDARTSGGTQVLPGPLVARVLHDPHDAMAKPWALWSRDGLTVTRAGAAGAPVTPAAVAPGDYTELRPGDQFVVPPGSPFAVHYGWNTKIPFFVAAVVLPAEAVAGGTTFVAPTPLPAPWSGAH